MSDNKKSGTKFPHVESFASAARRAIESGQSVLSDPPRVRPRPGSDFDPQALVDTAREMGLAEHGFKAVLQYSTNAGNLRTSEINAGRALRDMVIQVNNFVKSGQLDLGNPNVEKFFEQVGHYSIAPNDSSNQELPWELRNVPDYFANGAAIVKDAKLRVPRGEWVLPEGLIKQESARTV